MEWLEYSGWLDNSLMKNYWGGWNKQGGANVLLHLSSITGGYPINFTPFDSSSSVHSYATPFTPYDEG